MDSDALDFSAVETPFEVAVHADGGMTAMVVVSIVVFVAVVGVTAWLGVRLNRGHPPRRLLIRDLPGSIKLLAALVVLSLLAVQAIAGADAFVQVTRNFDSTADYFRHLTFARLLGMSHAHIFGYLVMYGAFAALASATRIGEAVKCLLISAILWAGLFDVASWWAIRCFSARFEWLSIATATASVGTSLAVTGLVVREFFSTKSVSGERSWT